MQESQTQESVMEKSFGLVDHVLAVTDALPPIRAAVIEYVYAENGVFVRARRPGVEAMIPYVECRLNYLDPVQPYVTLEYPKVPAALVEEMLALSREAAAAGVEILFYLLWEDSQWRLVVPKQRQSAWAVEPVETGAGSSFSFALVEAHSHRHESARFSPTDDKGEFNLRFYAVMGRVNDDVAEIRLRIGVNGHTCEIPAATLFELPASVNDCLGEID